MGLNAHLTSEGWEVDPLKSPYLKIYDDPTTGQPNIDLGGQSYNPFITNGVRKLTNISAFIPAIPDTFVNTGSATSAHAWFTGPDDFDGVALFAAGSVTDADDDIINEFAIAVTDRLDRSKLIPEANGVQYNQLAPAGTQNGWIRGFWDAGDIDITSASIAASSVIGYTGNAVAVDDKVVMGSVAGMPAIYKLEGLVTAIDPGVSFTVAINTSGFPTVGTTGKARLYTKKFQKARSLGTGDLSLKISEIVPVASLSRVDDPAKFPVAMVRIVQPQGKLSCTQFANAAEAEAFWNGHAPYEAGYFAQTGNTGISNPSSFTTTTYSTTPRIFGLVFRLKKSGDLIFVAGDSILRGNFADGTAALSALNKGVASWAKKAALAQASKTHPVGYINAAWSGMNSARYFALAKKFFDSGITYTIAVFTPFTPNDSPSGSIAAYGGLERGREFAEYLLKNRVQPVYVTPVPFQTGGANTIRLRIVDSIKSNGIIPYIDANAALFDPDGTTSAWLPGTTADYVHPLVYGQDLIVPGGTQVLSDILKFR